MKEHFKYEVRYTIYRVKTENCSELENKTKNYHNKKDAIKFYNYLKNNSFLHGGNDDDNAIYNVDGVYKITSEKII